MSTVKPRCNTSAGIAISTSATGILASSPADLEPVKHPRVRRCTITAAGPQRTRNWGHMCNLTADAA
eukprot:14209318-Alexandrium_andersonii.AAC.1